MEQKRVTLREIAEATGYTMKTVSRAMQPDAVISPKTRALILRKAEELGYYPNRAASALRGKRSYTIACIVGYLVNPYFGMLYIYLSKAAEKLGYTLLLFSSAEDAETELKAVTSAICYGVDGVLLLPCPDSHRSLELLRRHNIPVVLICREAPGETVDCVMCDEETSGYLVGQHLLEHGHRRMAFVRERDVQPSIAQRRVGFLRAIREAGLPEDSVSILGGKYEDSLMEAADVGDSVLHLFQTEGLTGIAVFCDLQARQLIGELHRRGFDCTAHLGIIGFDNLDAVTPSGLPICSVGADYEAMCSEAVALLYSRINNDTVPPVTHVFPVSLMCRGSCHPSALWLAGQEQR